MCFAPQRRALFRHRNFQKWSDAEVFCTFWLGNVLRATTACTFLTSQLPKVVRDRQFLTLLTSKCASHHNGVQFFIAPVASWLRTRRFSEPTFRPSGATNHWKNTVFRDFPTFSRICIFCLLTLSLLIFSLLIFLFSLPLPCSAFHLSILLEVWLLNFLRQSPSPNLDDLPLRCDGCEMVSCVVGSFSDHARIILGPFSDRFRIVNGVSTVFRACAVDRIPLWFATVGSFPHCKWDCKWCWWMSCR